MERLQKYIADCGYTSRRKAEELIRNNQVYVNGKLVNELGFKVENTDIVTIDGVIITKNNLKEYYMLNKPREVICSVSDEAKRKTVVDYIKTESRIYPVGRLDYDTTGLVLLTNDGKLANILMHPRNEVYKTYIAKINGILQEEDFQKLRKGILIEDRKLVVDHFKVKSIDKIKNTSLVEVVIHEGRNHIVKKLFAHLGYDVLKLTRQGYGGLTLGNLRSGEYRKLSKEEVQMLYKLK